jgi:hypothetical protein
MKASLLAALRGLAGGLLTLAWLAAQSAPPQTVYRCGPEGRIYSQTPCADGKALSVDDPRSATQQNAARDVAAKDAEQARKLADERRRREEAAKGQQAAGFKAPAPADAASAPARKGKAKAPSAASAPPMSPPMRVPTQASPGK